MSLSWENMPHDGEGRWVTLRRIRKGEPFEPGRNAVWVAEGDQLFSVTYQTYVGAPDAETALERVRGQRTGGDWVATPRALPPTPDQPELPEAMIGRVHGRVQSGPADSESAQVKADTDRP